MMDISTRVTGTLAFLGAASVGRAIAFEVGHLDTTGDTPEIIYDVVEGVITSFERVYTMPHVYIRFTLDDDGQIRKSRPDLKIVFTDQQGA